MDKLSKLQFKASYYEAHKVFKNSIFHLINLGEDNIIEPLKTDTVQGLCTS